MNRLYWESDGDRYPKDVYICESETNDRLCTMEGTNEAQMKHRAQEICNAVNAAQHQKNLPDSVTGWVPTKEQLVSLCNLILRYERAPDDMTTHTVGLPGVIMVRFNELWIGIEPDGYAHS
jgi:hypothetical protein